MSARCQGVTVGSTPETQSLDAGQLDRGKQVVFKSKRETCRESDTAVFGKAGGVKKNTPQLGWEIAGPSRDCYLIGVGAAGSFHETPIGSTITEANP